MIGHAGLLLLYTDGLIERRRTPLDHGLQQLLTILEQHSSEPVADVAELLLERMTGDEVLADDVCILAARAHPPRPGFYFGFAPAVTELARCRHELRDWLRQQGVPRDDEQLILLAVGEAVSNAVEHGHGALSADGPGDRGLVEVSAAMSFDRELFVSVCDTGRWIERSPTPGRGRGMHIMRATMDRVERDTNGLGTEIRLMRNLAADRRAG
jgi:anti-sigma regulatory factor (Ser/Thr protein kinase)